MQNLERELIHDRYYIAIKIKLDVSRTSFHITPRPDTKLKL